MQDLGNIMAIVDNWFYESFIVADTSYWDSETATKNHTT